MKHLTCSHGPTNDYIVASPIGNLRVKSCPSGLHSLHQTDDITDDTFQPNDSLQVELVRKQYEDNGYTYKPVVKCLQWLDCYFHDPAGLKGIGTPPICKSVVPSKGGFRGLVWTTLAEQVAFGETVSYGTLATLCGRSRAARAVGSAMRGNPIQLIVPCHRVVRSDGEAGIYSGGRRNTVKTWLLDHEKRSS